MDGQEAADLAHEIRGVLSELRKHRGNTNTIRVDGGIIATISCVAMLFVVLALMIFESRSYNDLSRKVDKEAAEIRQELTPQLDQLRAWNDVNRGKIAVLEARTAPPQEKK